MPRHRHSWNTKNKIGESWVIPDEWTKRGEIWSSSVVVAILMIQPFCCSTTYSPPCVGRVFRNFKVCEAVRAGGFQRRREDEGRMVGGAWECLFELNIVGNYSRRRRRGHRRTTERGDDDDEGEEEAGRGVDKNYTRLSRLIIIILPLYKYMWSPARDWRPTLKKI